MFKLWPVSQHIEGHQYRFGVLKSSLGALNIMDALNINRFGSCLTTFAIAFGMNSIAQASTQPYENMVATSSNTDNLQGLFLDCATLTLDSARLACYDKAARGETSTAGQQKKPLDLVESFKASINKGKPKIVLSDDQHQSGSNSVDAMGEAQPTSLNSNSDNYQINDATIAASDNVNTGLDLSKSDSQILADAGVTAAAINQYTPLSLAYDLDKNSERGVFTVRPYNPIYLLPVFTTFEPNRSPKTPTQPAYNYSFDEYDPLELKAQISLKTKVMEDVFDTNADLWFGYTQQMHWQVYNEDNSRPFRATDYMPEIFITQPVTANLPFDGQLRMLGAGAIHHSNGQSDPLSRSWNRIYLMGGAEWGRLTVLPKAWAHIKNETDAKPSDNPDITDYYGYGELTALYDFGKGETIGASGRYNFDTNKGAIEVDYIHPFTPDLHGFLQIFHGYGESIIDYNHKTTSIGVGVSLKDWKGL